jgi:hypothetical protein
MVTKMLLLRCKHCGTAQVSDGNRNRFTYCHGCHQHLVLHELQFDIEPYLGGAIPEPRTRSTDHDQRSAEPCVAESDWLEHLEPDWRDFEYMEPDLLDEPL